jgi:hypothetical protein
MSPYSSEVCRIRITLDYEVGESFYQDATSEDSECTVFAETPVELEESYDMRIPVKRTEAPSPV